METQDALLKREEFAVSLRKKKKVELISAKRKRYIRSSKSNKKVYRECPLFSSEERSHCLSIDQILDKFVPDLATEGETSENKVSDSYFLKTFAQEIDKVKAILRTL